MFDWVYIFYVTAIIHRLSHICTTLSSLIISACLNGCATRYRISISISIKGECQTVYDNNWALIDQDSGVCTGDLFSAFTSADPDPNSVNSAIRYSLFTSFVLSSNQTYDTNIPEGLKFYIEDENNPRSELPDYVLFPRDATDVIHAVKFASKNLCPGVGGCSLPD